MSNTAPVNGQVLKFNGTQWVPGTDNSSSLVLPYSSTANSALNLFFITNQGAGAAVEGVNSSTAASTIGVVGKISSAAAGSSSAGLRGINNGTGVNGVGIWGSHNGFGSGVYGVSTSGNGVYGKSTDGVGVFGTSATSSAGLFDISDPSNTSDALAASHVGDGSAISAYSENGYGLLGVTNSALPYISAVMGQNFGGGEAITGITMGGNAGAVVGRNWGSSDGVGVQGIGSTDGGAGVLATAYAGGSVAGNALVASLEGSGSGNPAVFMANGASVARIDETGKGFFNGGTQVGGADLAEYFDV